MSSYQRQFSFIFILMVFLIGTASAQRMCKDNYIRVYGLYARGQYEQVNNSFGDCLNDFRNFQRFYFVSAGDRDIRLVFKVYKLIITSYKQLDRENEANNKWRELVAYFSQKFNEAQVSAQYAQTNLDPLR